MHGYTNGYTYRMGRKVDEHEARQQAYDDAVKTRDELIDNPDKTVTFDVYRDRLKAAQKDVDEKHAAVMDGYIFTKIRLSEPRRPIFPLGKIEDKRRG